MSSAKCSVLLWRGTPAGLSSMSSSSEWLSGNPGGPVAARCWKRSAPAIWPSLRAARTGRGSLRTTSSCTSPNLEWTLLDRFMTGTSGIGSSFEGSSSANSPPKINNYTFSPCRILTGSSNFTYSGMFSGSAEIMPRTFLESDSENLILFILSKHCLR